MCTKWLWSYPVDVAVAVAQYSDKTYFFQTPTSSIPVFEKRWKEKNAKLWLSAKCEGKMENSLRKHRQPQLCHMNPKMATFSTKVTQKRRTDNQTLGGVKFISTF